MPGVAARFLCNLLGRAFRHNLPAFDPAFGTQIDDPVCGFDDVEIMFDDDDAVTLLDEAVENLEEFADIFEMQAGGGLVQNVERLSSGSAGKFLGQFYALRLATR